MLNRARDSLALGLKGHVPQLQADFIQKNLQTIQAALVARFTFPTSQQVLQEETRTWQQAVRFLKLVTANVKVGPDHIGVNDGFDQPWITNWRRGFKVQLPGQIDQLLGVLGGFLGARLELKFFTRRNGRFAQELAGMGPGSFALDQ
jgi:hypothetical protein